MSSAQDVKFPITGNFRETLEATEDTQKICDQVKSAAEEQTGKIYKMFTAVQYRKQSVQGANYIIKIHVGDEVYLHIWVYQKLPCYGGALLLQRLQEDKSKEDCIETF